MPPSRRTFLKGLGAVTLAPALPGCSNGNDSLWIEGGTVLPPPNPLPERPVPSQNFDFPIISELPFAHAVASGDPLPDRVIIWTRVTEEEPSLPALPVEWRVATDPGMGNVIASGTQDAVPDHDWTIK